MIEVWKDVVDYEGLYQVSNLGRIKTVLTNRIRKLVPDKDGYMTVMLYKKCVNKNLKVHRLVAYAFIENEQLLPIINHKDEVKSNNTVSNLEWCTDKYNKNYGTRKNLYAKPLVQLTLDGEVIRFFDSTQQTTLFGFCQKHVSACCIGKRKTHKGSLWKYIKKETLQHE